MACFRPLDGWLNVRLGGRPLMRFPVGEDPRDFVYQRLRCRRCLGCLADRARDVSLRAMHEAAYCGEASFLTLTYDREHLPWESSPLVGDELAMALKQGACVLPHAGSLCRRDVVLFMKRLRARLFADFGKRVRGYVVGEYGGVGARPHYHICLFGHAFYEDRRDCGKSQQGYPMFDSKYLDETWGKGFCRINEMGQEVAQYAAKYAMKSQGSRLELRTSGDGHVFKVPLPFDSLPRGRALGVPWLKEFWSDVFPRGVVVLRGGVELPAPLAYMKVLREWDEDAFEEIALRRRADGLRLLAENMPQRLATREAVALAAAARSKRDAA